ncbi:MAG: 16S rRNA (cytosine(967)-C(5))-methyltransferase RsmB [Proteobacteria bacterium]|nr:16S rRNA (cytosine(967)-C(5))-methyltransferase RsmB [Pseudomonadota bacterium]
MSAVRLQAAVACQQIIDTGHSIDHALDAAKKSVEPDDAGQLQAIVYGVVRHYNSLESILKPLLNKPFRNKDRDIYFLLLSAIYQLVAMRAPDHAVVNDSVNATKSLKKKWARAVVNGCLREFLRAGVVPQESWINSVQEHPEWLRAMLHNSWQDKASLIMAENLIPAELTLRVNRNKTDQLEYLEQLEKNNLNATSHPFAPDAIVLDDAVPVEVLPGFSDGFASVQDAAAQMASVLLNPQVGDHVLDACAAPGGKTGHLLEITNGNVDLVSADISEKRINRVRENLTRLNLNCELIVSDLSTDPSWWDGRLFDRILLDAPCSSTGVIRRHPDILRHRNAQDIPQLIQIQLALLTQLWRLLKPEGMLLYATCSILSEENDAVIDTFIKNHNDATPMALPHPQALKTTHGYQTLPSHGLSDGFYTCGLLKS